MKAYLKGYLKITDDKVASDYAPLSGEAVAPDPSAPVIVGLPVISGVERAGETLTATPASVTGYPTPDITWQWERSGSPISGATNSTYLLVAADIGEALTVVQTATNSEGSDTAESAATGVIGDALTAPVITGLPSIAGVELVGEILTATPASVTGNPTPDITWQWERSGSPISGATNSTYLLVAADIGETLTVVQTATNSEGSDTAESAATGVIGDALTAPVITGLPSIAGVELVGEILTATPAFVTGNPTPDITWQWERSGSPISGATNSTYLLVAADIGETLTVVQTATNSEGSDTAESAATGVIGDALTAPVITGLPSIAGVELVGEILTATPAFVTGNPTPDITWQWERSGSPISGATNSTYLLVAADIGETLTVVQTATNSEGSDTAESAATGVIGDALTAPVITGLPSIAGVELVGEILTATPASVTGNPTPDITWQWERSGSPISGATNSTYLLVAADIGETLTVVQTATNSEGSDAAESAATGVIGDALTAPVITGLPSIAGVELVGEILTATPASVTGNPTPDITWQWERSGSPISGATNSTYLLVAADIGETLTVVQTATNSEGSDAAESAATGAIPDVVNGWKYRLAIPIRPTQSALIGFTAVLTDAMLPAAVTDVLFDATEGALASGGDLRVTADEDGEIIVGLDALRRWDKAAGKMEIAYFVPSTSAALTTTLYLWWGKDNATQPAAGAVGGQHSAYDNDTIFCAPVGGGANRTAFNITGTDVGGITAGDIAAPSGLLGTQHTDVGDYSTYGDNPDLDLINTDWTISFLFRATTSGLEQYVLGKYDHTTQNRGYLCMFSGSQHFDLTYQPVPTSYDPTYRLSSGVDVVDGQWHHLAGTFISGTRASVYTDGILRNTATNNIPSSVASNDASFQIGTQVTAQNRPADFSHVTVHSIARSAEWLKAENDNFRDPNSFYDTFPAPENVDIELPY
jgi:hypothetical protein